VGDVMTRLRGIVLVATAVGVLAVSGAARAAWPGSDGAIVFTYDQVASQVNPDGSGLRRIGGWDFFVGEPHDLVWSPDSRYVAFEAPWGDGYDAPEIWIDGHVNDYPLEDWGGTDVGRDFDPAWSPDGRTLMFICQRNPIDPSSTVPTGICSAPAVRDAPATLVVPGTFDAFAWSPDGGLIAYSSASGLYVAAADGTRPRNIYAPGLGSLDWSPDGARLTGVTDGGEVVTVDVRTGAVRSIGIGFDPAWSPDGTALVFTARDGSGWSLAIADSHGVHFIVDRSTGKHIHGVEASWLPRPVARGPLPPPKLPKPP
jgi:WD40 repeat protein